MKGLQAIDDQATAKKERKHQDCAGAALQGWHFFNLGPNKIRNQVMYPDADNHLWGNITHINEEEVPYHSCEVHISQDILSSQASPFVIVNIPLCSNAILFPIIG